MSKTTHYELNTPIGSEVLSVMTGLNPNFNTIDETMYDNETRSTQALNKANVNEQNIATALGRITTAEGDIDTLESGLETANTNISGLTSRMSTAESNIVSANNRIQENTNQIVQINENLSDITTWKSAGTLSAGSTLTLPTSFKELLVDFTILLGTENVRATLNLPKEVLGSVFRYYRTGYYARASSNASFSVEASLTEIKSLNVWQNGNDLTNQSGALSCEVYYR